MRCDVMHQVLGITLTKRNTRAAASSTSPAAATEASHTSNSTDTPTSTSFGDIPMAGIPAERLSLYLKRLIDQHIRVAVCEQISETDTRTSTGTGTGADTDTDTDTRIGKGKGTRTSTSPKILSREIRRLVTPGTLVEDTFLEPRHHAWLCAIHVHDMHIGMSWMDLSTGDTHTLHVTSVDAMLQQLATIAPAEIIVSDDIPAHVATVIHNMAYTITSRPHDTFRAHQQHPLYHIMRDASATTDTATSTDTTTDTIHTAAYPHLVQ